MRHTVAKWLPTLSLSSRLAVFVVLIVIGVVASVALLETRVFERDIERDLADAARLGALSAADSVAARREPFDPMDVRDALHDLADADPRIDAISVIEADRGGQLHVVTSTSTEERAEAMELARRALQQGAPSSERAATVVMQAAPVPRHANHAVVVTVGLESLFHVCSHAVAVALGFALPTIILVTLLVHLTVRQFVSRPLDAILNTMDATAAGDARRAAVARNDEIGKIATGLNAMLDQLDRFNRSLREQVEEATGDLSLRNAQLAESHEQLFSARESLAQAERVAALGQLAASVAHQAGTPLNLVSGYVQMIRDDPKTDERTKSRLLTVDAQIHNVARVLRTLLDSARPAPGLERVEIASVIERVREVAQPRLSRARIRFETTIAPELPPIDADVMQLEMALLNLVTNALDAMPQGGTLSIEAVLHDGSVRIDVADTGPGIPTAILDRLFQPWVTTKPAGHGSGLGLAIVRDVVHSLGGGVSAHNRESGALFVIELPVAHSRRASA